MSKLLFPIVVSALCFMSGATAFHFAILNSAENIGSRLTFEGVTLMMSAEEEVRLGENLIINFEYANGSADNVWVIRPSLLYVRDENRTLIGVWPSYCIYPCCRCVPGWEEVLVEPGESYSENFVWGLTVYPICVWTCVSSICPWPPPTELEPGTYYLSSSLSCRKNTASVGIWLTLEITILPHLSE